MIRVEGHSYLYRDEESGAIVNTNDVAYSNRLKSIERQKQEKIRLDEMRSEIDELKSLVKQLLKNSTS